MSQLASRKRPLFAITPPTQITKGGVGLSLSILWENVELLLGAPKPPLVQTHKYLRSLTHTGSFIVNGHIMAEHLSLVQELYNQLIKLKII